MVTVYKQGKNQSPPEHDQMSRAGGLSLRRLLRIPPPEYRRPARITGQYSGIVGPHALTERWTYTVPNLRRAQIEAAIAQILRTTVAAPIGRIAAQILYKAFGHQEVPLLSVISLNNTVATSEQDRLRERFLMFPGDTLRGVSSDAGTGGTIEFLLSASVMEFDE